MLDEQLESILTSPGSTLYYALRRVPAQQRIPCLGLWRLYHELREVVFSRSETAYVQLGWWHQELERLLAGKPRHPATRAISTWQTFTKTQPLEWLADLEPLLGVSQFNDENELSAFCATISTPLCAAHRLLSGMDAANPQGEFITNTSIAYTLFDFFHNLGQYLRDGIVPIPLSELDCPYTQASDLLRPNDRPKYINIMQLQHNRILRTLKDTHSKLPGEARLKQHVALTIGAIHEAILEEIQRSDYDVVNCYTDITPVRKAWIAWRTYRQTRQH